MISQITSLLDHLEQPQQANGDPLRQFETELPDFHLWVAEKRIDSHVRELMTAEPRTAVVDAAVLLEEHIKHLLETSTVRVEGYRKFQKASYTEAASWAYRLGLIDAAMVKELMAMDRIRDWIVLGWPQKMDFEDREIPVIIDRLRSPRLFFPTDEGAAQRPWSMKVFSWTMKRDRRDWWELAVAALLGELVDLLREAERPEVDRVSWA